MAKRFEKQPSPEYVAQKRTTGAAELNAIREKLGISQAELSRIYQVVQPDFNKMIHAKLSVPERCLPIHYVLCVRVLGIQSSYKV